MGTKVGRSIGSKHKYDGTADAQKYIQKTIQNASAHVKNFLPAIMQLMKVNSNPTAVNSIGAQNFSSIMSQVSSHFSSGPQEEKLEFDCELLLMTPNNELTEEQLVKKEICEELLAFVDEEIRTGTVNNDVVVANTGQTGADEFGDSQSGLSITLAQMSNLTSDVGDQTTYASNNFTHVANDTVIIWTSNSLSTNATFMTWNANGHVVLANSVEVTETATFSNTVDVTGQLTLTSPVTLPSYTVAGVPSASPAGQIAFISDETGGATIAFTDGTNWRRATDLTIIA